MSSREFFQKENKWIRFLLLCDVFSIVFWKKLKTPKRHFEINWPLAKVRILVTKYLKLSANVIYERTLICSSFLASISSFSCRLSIAALVSLRTCFNWSLAFSLVSVRLLILISASNSFSIWSLRSAKRLALKKVKRKYIEKSKI